MIVLTHKREVGKKMRVVGIDPDTKAITWAVTDTEAPGIVHVGRVEAKGRRAEDRLCMLVDLFYHAIPEFDTCDWIYVERPVVVGGGARKINRKAIIDQSIVVGAIRALLYLRGQNHTLVDPGTWKRAVLGDGHASKEDIKRWALAHFKGLKDDHPQDFYDAVCIACFDSKAGGAV